jgi:hypothetical protein
LDPRRHNQATGIISVGRKLKRRGTCADLC